MDKLNKPLSIFFLSILILACVEPYDIDVKVTNEIITIDGAVDDQSPDQYISIRKTLPSQNSGVIFIPESDAKVEVLENDIPIACIEKVKGRYHLPVGFKAKVGSFYQLSIDLKSGKKYRSSKDIMKSTPIITGFSVKFDTKAIKRGENNLPGHLIYVNSKDNPEKGDNYVWTWKLWENQDVCISCYGGRYYTTPAPAGRCISERALTDASITYDYNCGVKCWEILYSKELNVMNDNFSNGLEIKNRLVARVPFYQNKGFLIEVSQQNVSVNAYQYLKLLIEQNQNSGSLIDSPPAPLIGNVKNLVDESETVGGYFLVGSKKSKRIWVPREEQAEPQYLLGRPTENEPSSPDGLRPPTAPCLPSLTRTPLKPEGWQ